MPKQKPLVAAALFSMVWLRFWVANQGGCASVQFNARDVLLLCQRLEQLSAPLERASGPITVRGPKWNCGVCVCARVVFALN